MIFDCHCHLTDARYETDRLELLEKIDKMEDFDFAILGGTSLKDSENCLTLAKSNKKLFTTAGIHPSEIETSERSDIEKLRELLSYDKVIAVGEIGLDYHFPPFSKEKQKDFFVRQLNLARELGKPVVIHQRDAANDMFEILKDYKDLKIVLHCFSESLETAKRYEDFVAGFSFAGTLTFQNNRVGKSVAEHLPLEKILVETDSPYLTPHPFRGKRNEPPYVKFVMEKLAELKGLETEQVEKIIRSNVKEIFGI